MELKQGEFICEKCEGHGTIPPMKQSKRYLTPGVYMSCPKCHGEGKLDWIENVVGKKPPMVDMTKDLHVQWFAKKPKKPKDGDCYHDVCGGVNIYNDGGWLKLDDNITIG